MKDYHILAVILLFGCFGCKEQPGVTTVRTSSDYQKGEALLYHKNDSAFYYFNKAANSSQDSLEVAMAYNNMAAIQSDAGDYFGSQESLSISLKYLDERKKRDYYCISSDYNELGTTSLNLKNYVAALAYYDLALKFAQDDSYRRIFLNNKATVYQKKGEYDSASTIYSSIINQSKETRKEYARVVSNLARVRWLQNPRYVAGPEFMLALKIREIEKDEWGLNASYAHLSDYYSSFNADSALAYAGKMYSIARKLDSPDDELEAIQKLIALSPAQSLKAYFQRYQYLSDSLQTARNSAKNQFALIRFDAEKNKADNLKLLNENANKAIQIIRQRIFIGGTIIFFLIAAVVAFRWYQRRRQRILLETQNQIREGQLKTSKKVHDVVANGLYHIMATTEHQDDLDREWLLDKLENLYEKSRDISYEYPDNIRQDYQNTIAELLGAFVSRDTKVFVVGNRPDLWADIKLDVKKEVELILQELMVNMKKHSSAKNVAVRFDRESNCLKIQYTDDGIGLLPGFKYGNGLTNMGNRIKGMGGQIIFDKETTKGLKILIHFPIT